jgi:hypothetical protein
MNILKVRAKKISNFKIARLLLSNLFVRAARALLCNSSLKFGGVGTCDSEDRKMLLRRLWLVFLLSHCDSAILPAISLPPSFLSSYVRFFSDLSQISSILEHGFYVWAKRTSWRKTRAAVYRADQQRGHGPYIFEFEKICQTLRARSHCYQLILCAQLGR